MNYLVIIGDIIKSRSLPDRKTIQTTFEKTLKATTNRFRDAIVSPFTLTIGDEFQTVLKDADQLFDIIESFEYSMDFLDFRYGLGLGSIATSINSQAAIGMDGPAFHNARESLNLAKEKKSKYYFTSHNPGDNLINNLLAWLTHEFNTWTRQKAKAVFLYNKHHTQTKIAAELKISQPAISKIIRNTEIDLINQSKSLLSDNINQIIRNC